MRCSRVVFRSYLRQRGFTLIELSVAILIGLFLLGGLLTMVQNNRRAFASQNQIAVLQDNERLAMTMITNVIQAAGYFPNPTLNTLTGTLVAAPPLTAGQSVYGQDNVNAQGDTLTLRLATAPGDGVLNCTGLSNPVGGANPALYTNEFSVDNTGALVCALNGANPIPLVTGLQRMDVVYGVKRNFGVDDNNVDTYLTAAQMAAADWPNVISIRVTLRFLNPFYIAGQANPPQFIDLTRVVGVMNRSGIKI